LLSSQSKPDEDGCSSCSIANMQRRQPRRAALANRAAKRTAVTNCVICCVSVLLVCCVCCQDGATPAYIAAYKGRTEILKALIEARADLNKPEVACLSGLLGVLLIHGLSNVGWRVIRVISDLVVFGLLKF
jgi:hypothetical protein